jgi:hypothetical protein
VEVREKAMFHRVFACTLGALLCSGAANASTTAGPVQQVIVASSFTHHGTQTQCSAGWVNLPGASIRVTIPAVGNQLLTARLAASVILADTAGPTGAVGMMRIVSGAKVLQPDDGGGEPVTIGENQTSPAALERSIVATPGSHLVAAQFCQSGGDFSNVFQVNSEHLTVEAAPLP